MATNFPGSLDDFTNYVDGTTIMEAATLNNMQFGIEALQAKVGIDDSIVTTSHDYRLLRKLGELTDPTTEDSETNAMLKSHAYLAQSDGVVRVTVTSSAADQPLRGFVGSTTNPAGAGDIAQMVIPNTSSQPIGINFTVKSGEYFEITNTQTPVIKWLSFGTQVKPIDQD